jgi:hypothetical protein
MWSGTKACLDARPSTAGDYAIAVERRSEAVSTKKHVEFPVVGLQLRRREKVVGVGRQLTFVEGTEAGCYNSLGSTL